MPINTRGKLWIFALNVGQGDTSVIVSPKGGISIVDACKPRKLINLLLSLGMKKDDTIERLIITHPHNDHYSGALSLLKTFKVESVYLATDKYFKGYWKVIDEIRLQKIQANFVISGLNIYLDNAPDYNLKEKFPVLELFGPTFSKLSALDRAKKLEPNHLSIIVHVTWNEFRMIIGADAQESNWAHYDQEEMLTYSCTFYRAAHHGSSLGTNLERLKKLIQPKWIYVSSDPNGTFKLPDKEACSIFKRLAKDTVIALSHCVGSLKIEVSVNSEYEIFHFRENKDMLVPLNKPHLINLKNNPTNWDLINSYRDKNAVIPEVLTK